MFPFIDPIQHVAQHRDRQGLDPGVLPWEAKRTIRRGSAEALRFDTHPPVATAPPPESRAGTGGPSGWLSRLFRPPARAAAL